MRSGLDLDGRDLSVRPQDDLFAHANGGWLADVEIPADRGRFGTFDLLRERAEEHVRDLIQDSADGDPAPGTPAAQVADLYASFLDEDRIEALGARPIEGLLEAVRQIDSTTELARVLGDLARAGVGGAFLPFVNTDDKDPDRYVLYLEQGGLGLPDESYYREHAHEGALTAYVPHVSRMLALAGWERAQEAATTVVALETELAGGHLDKVSNRDPVKTYTLLDRAGLAEIAPHFDWSAWMEGLGGPEEALDHVVVRQPDYLRTLDGLLVAVPLSSWRQWLGWHVVRAFAPYLQSALVEENFDFVGRTLSGVPQLRDRWKRAVSLVEGALGEAVGQLYVERHFPPSAKAAMETLVEHLVEAFRQRFAELEWMSPGTREQALTKLESFTPKIGYPNTWRDYSTLTVERDDLVGNVIRASAFETDRALAKLGGPVDRDEWFMTPQTVNAYYNPGMNEIVFPAAILQPPFFDEGADDAANYGGIGAVIGHEIGHGFDDSGSQYDGRGALRNWWTEDDRERFTTRAQSLISQFDALEAADAPGHRVNGALTVGENIGDLCGLEIGHAAYRLSLGDEPAPVLDGLTGDQRFFLGWAQVWRGTAREAEAIRLLAVDPHAPMDLRANTVRNVDRFHEAFETAPGDGLWIEADERVRVF